MIKKKIAVFVSGGGTNLGALIKAQQIGELKSGEIAVVISNNKSAYALVRAKDALIPSEIVLKSEEGSQENFEKKIISILDKYQIDVIVLAGFMTILSSDFTKKYDERIINVHPSLIPSFCGKGYYGLKVHEEALKKGVKVTGATVHFVNEIPDGGKIIMQKAVAVKDGDTPEKLQKRVMRLAEWVILPRAVEKVCADLQGE